VYFVGLGAVWQGRAGPVEWANTERETDAMADDLKCPNCGGPMDLAMFAPGDKIARCAYCQTVVDLPDDPGSHEKIVEVEESEAGKGFTRKKTTRVVERNTRTGTGVKGEVGEEAIKDIFKQFGIDTEGEGGAFSLAEGNFGKKTLEDSNVSVSFTTTGGGAGELPPEALKMLKEMGVDPNTLGSAGGAPDLGKEKPPTKKSFWRRLLGK
jgi:LSD1 subclass zinc finger protein